MDFVNARTLIVTDSDIVVHRPPSWGGRGGSAHPYQCLLSRGSHSAMEFMLMCAHSPMIHNNEGV